MSSSSNVNSYDTDSKSTSTLKGDEPGNKKKKPSNDKCCGYRGALESKKIFENFPFQLIGTEDLPNIKIVNDSFHHASCDGFINKQCKDLQYMQRLNVNSM